MPPHISKAVVSHHSRSCYIKDCPYRGRKAGVILHMKEVHGVDDIKKWWKEQFQKRLDDYRARQTNNEEDPL